MFGKFKDIEAFLESYIREDEQKKMDYINSLSGKERIMALQSAVQTDVAEVQATIEQRQPDDTQPPMHYQMIINIKDIIQSAPDITADVEDCETNNLPVFLAIRFGDSEGLLQPISAGLNNGDVLHLKGQWIPKDKAYSHGGEKTSVLHFTHHPLGFTCTTDKCYS